MRGCSSLEHTHLGADTPLNSRIQTELLQAMDAHKQGRDVVLIDVVFWDGTEYKWVWLWVWPKHRSTFIFWGQPCWMVV